MARQKEVFHTKEAVEFLNHLMVNRPFVSFLVPLLLLGWVIERWVFSFSNWVPLVVAVWATIQYGNFQRRTLVEDLNKKWQQLILSTSPVTPLEQCEWLNVLLNDVWPGYFKPKLSRRFSSIVGKRLKHRKSMLIERIELQEFSLGSCPPRLGLHGTRWTTSGCQRIMHMGFDWDTNDINIMLLAKLAKPFPGTARIVVNSLGIKGDILLMPVLDGKAVLYSFESTPEVRIGVVFGSGGSQALPATELPGVSSWLVKVLTDTLEKTMVEPRRRCFSLPSVDLRKMVVGGMISVTVISASKLSGSSMKGSLSERQQGTTSNGTSEDNPDNEFHQTFVEVELEKLTRRTKMSPGSSPRWDATFNMVLHEETGILRFNLYECTPGNVKYDYLTSCEIKVKYVADDSTTFWAIGPGCSALVKHVESCGKEVEMVIPFEGTDAGELTVKLVLKEWQFADGSDIMNNSIHSELQQLSSGSSNLQFRTGRKINITVVEGKDLIGRDKFGKCNSYVKIQYGKALYRTSMTPHSANPVWNQKFEVDELGGGEYLTIKCFLEDMFVDDNIGSARVDLAGLLEGSLRDVWIPLENVSTGELRLQMEALRTDDFESRKNAMVGSGIGWIELVLIEAKDLIAADLRGTSDPYVRVQYGNIKKRTKVMYKTLNPQWNQTLEFLDDGSPLVLHVKDHNAVLPTSSIGDCVVEYRRLPRTRWLTNGFPFKELKRGKSIYKLPEKFHSSKRYPT